MMLQVGGALPTTPLELLLISSVETKVVLAILLVFSLIAWFIIVLKWWQFRRLHRQGGKFFAELERTTRLQEGYHAAMKQPPSPYNRLFREAINFYSELRPGALKEEVVRTPLTSTQLESLKLVLMKEVSAEKDMLSRYIPWLATVGSVGPLPFGSLRAAMSETLLATGSHHYISRRGNSAERRAERNSGPMT